MIPVLSSKKASELPVDEVASILQVSPAALRAALVLPVWIRKLGTAAVLQRRAR